MSTKLDSCRCPTGVRDSADVRLDIIAIAFFFSSYHRIFLENWYSDLISLFFFFFFSERISKNTRERSISHFERDDNGDKKEYKILLESYTLNSILVIFMIIKNSNSLWGEEIP